MASTQMKDDSTKDNRPFWDRAPSPSPPPTQRRKSETLPKRSSQNVTKPKSAPSLAQKKPSSPQSTGWKTKTSIVASLAKSKSVGSKVSKTEAQTITQPEPSPHVETKKKPTSNLPNNTNKLEVIKEESSEWPAGTKPATSLKDALAEFPTSPPDVKPMTKSNLKRRSSPRKAASKTPEVSKPSLVKDSNIGEGNDLTVNKTEANPNARRANRRDDKNLKVPVWMRDNVSKSPTKNTKDDQKDTTPFWERQPSKSPIKKQLGSQRKGKSISPANKRNLKKVQIPMEASSKNTTSKQHKEESDDVHKVKDTSFSLNKTPSKIPTSNRTKDPTPNKSKKENPKASQVKQSIPESKRNPTKATIDPKRRSFTAGSVSSRKTPDPATYDQHSSDGDGSMSPEKINKVIRLSGNTLDIKEKMSSVQSKIKTFRDDPWASKFKTKPKKEQTIKVTRLLNDGVKDKAKQLSRLKSRYGKMTIRKPTHDIRRANSDSEVDTKAQPLSNNVIKLTVLKQDRGIKISYSDSDIDQAADTSSDITVPMPPPVTTNKTKTYASKVRDTKQNVSPYISPSKVCKETQVTPTEVTQHTGKPLDKLSRQRTSRRKDYHQLGPEQHDNSYTSSTDCRSYVVDESIQAGVDLASGSFDSSDLQYELLGASVHDIDNNEDKEFSRMNERSPELKSSVYLGDEKLYQAAFTSGSNDDYIEDLRKVFINKLDVSQRNKIKANDRKIVMQKRESNEEIRQLGKGSPKMFHSGKWIDDRSIQWNESESNVMIFASSRKNDTGEDLDIRKERFKNSEHQQYDYSEKETSRDTKQHRDELQVSSNYLDNKQIKLQKQIDFENTLQQNISPSIETESKHLEYEEEPEFEGPIIRLPEEAWSEEGYSSCSNSESDFDEETALQIKRDFKETLATLYENNYQLAVDILSLKDEFLQIKKDFEKRPLRPKKPGEPRPLGNLADYLMIVGVMAVQFALQYFYLKP